MESRKDVKEIKEVFTIDRANSLLNEGWVFVGMYVAREERNPVEGIWWPEETPRYVLGRRAWS